MSIELLTPNDFASQKSTHKEALSPTSHEAHCLQGCRKRTFSAPESKTPTTATLDPNDIAVMFKLPLLNEKSGELNEHLATG
jgi:hypothetical protein